MTSATEIQKPIGRGVVEEGKEEGKEEGEAGGGGDGTGELEKE